MANVCEKYREEVQKPSLPAGEGNGGGAQTTYTCPSNTMVNVSTQNTPPIQMRPRSLFTTHSFHAPSDDSTFQRYNEFSKCFETSSAEQWGGYSNPAAIWRQPRNPKPIAALPYYTTEETCVYTENWREYDNDNGASGGSAASGASGAIATQHGTISLRLHNRMRVDMTIDRAIRIINFKAHGASMNNFEYAKLDVRVNFQTNNVFSIVQNNIVLSLSGTGAAAALLHPNGRIYQYGSRVEILAHDAHGNNKYAKMWYKGVSFTSEQCALVYLVDTAGTRTTTDSFSDMSQDFSVSVFYSGSRHGSLCVQEAITVLRANQYWLTNEGVENWIINNVRISQTPDGLIRIARNSNKYQLRTSPSNGTASITTPFLHCTASLGQTSHLFVRRGERRMHYDGTSFIVRNAGHSAGFDDNNQLKVY